MSIHHDFRNAIAVFAIVVGLLSASPATACFGSFTVDSVEDEPDDLTIPCTCHSTPSGMCTLRAAIMQASRASEGAQINLPAGTYKLKLPSSGNDVETDGDLDLNAPMSLFGVTIEGASTGQTIIDGNQIDRVLWVHPSSSLKIKRVTIRNGLAVFPTGGGVRNDGVLEIFDSVIEDNTATFGGGIGNAGNGAVVVLDNVTVRINHSLNGGGILNDGGTVELRRSRIDGNTASNAGGGVFSIGTTLVGSLTVLNSTISSNNAKDGGGIWIGGGFLATINSTLSQNHATGNGGGLNVYGGQANIYNTTIAFNDADSDVDLFGLGGGIINRDADGAITNLRNSLVAGNFVSNSPTYSECNGTVNSFGRNMFWADGLTGCTVVTHFPGLTYSLNSLASIGPLQGNGGPTHTHALLVTSNAIDTGDPAVGCIDSHADTLTTDQRGFPRPIGPLCDIGAFEFNPAHLDVDDNKKFEPLTDGLLIMRYLFGVRDAALTVGALGGNAMRTDSTAIVQFLDGIKLALDVDANSQTDALTDGVMLIRYLMGVRSPELTGGGVIGANAQRDSAQIESYIRSLIPSSD